MEQKTPPRGLIVDLITPLTARGAVDARGLTRLLDRTAPHAQGIVLASPLAGEGTGLDTGMRCELLDTALTAVRGVIPLFVWVSQAEEDAAGRTLVSLEAVLRRRRYEGPVFWVDTPLFYHSNRGLLEHYRSLCEKSTVPFVLHNSPEFILRLARPLKRNNIRTAIVKDLSCLDRIVGMIFSGTLDRARNYQRASRRRGSFRIYDEDEGHFLDYPSMNGVVSIGANLSASSWLTVTRASLRISADRMNYPDYRRQVMEKGFFLRELFESYRALPVPVVKESLASMGVIDSPACASPAGDVSEPVARVRSLMERSGEWPSA